ncbi:hypothetical protein K438DRAFT_1998436 [Mycena galopus ATCC 62051]|nr:hypothetical protein K438DRAFT_1998436 [Mycena galopus ATCC 62051]
MTPPIQADFSDGESRNFKNNGQLTPCLLFALFTLDHLLSHLLRCPHYLTDPAKSPQSSWDTSPLNQTAARMTLNALIAMGECAPPTPPAVVADPANKAKKLEYLRLTADYVDIYDVPFIPDAELPAYIAKKTRQEFALDELRYQAVSTDPFRAAGPLDAYFVALRTYTLDFGHPPTFEDEYEEKLLRKKSLRKLHRRLLRHDEECIAQLAGRPVLQFIITNPFPPHNNCHADFDFEVRERFGTYAGNPHVLLPTVPHTDLGIKFTNPHHDEPFSIACQERYCYYEM